MNRLYTLLFQGIIVVSLGGSCTLRAMNAINSDDVMGPFANKVLTLAAADAFLQKVGNDAEYKEHFCETYTEVIRAEADIIKGLPFPQYTPLEIIENVCHGLYLLKVMETDLGNTHYAGGIIQHCVTLFQAFQIDAHLERVAKSDQKGDWLWGMRAVDLIKLFFKVQGRHKELQESLQSHFINDDKLYHNDKPRHDEELKYAEVITPFRNGELTLPVVDAYLRSLDHYDDGFKDRFCDAYFADILNEAKRLMKLQESGTESISFHLIENACTAIYLLNVIETKLQNVRNSQISRDLGRDFSLRFKDSHIDPLIIYAKKNAAYEFECDLGLRALDLKELFLGWNEECAVDKAKILEKKNSMGAVQSDKSAGAGTKPDEKKDPVQKTDPASFIQAKKSLSTSLKAIFTKKRVLLIGAGVTLLAGLGIGAYVFGKQKKSVIKAQPQRG